MVDTKLKRLDEEYDVKKQVSIQTGRTNFINRLCISDYSD